MASHKNSLFNYLFVVQTLYHRAREKELSLALWFVLNY